MIARLDAGLAWIEKILYIGAACALALMMLSIAGDALGRYLFDKPIAGVYEINEMYLLTAIVYLSIARAQRLNQHISVESLFHLMPHWAKRMSRTVGYFLTFGLFAAIAIRTGEMAYEQFIFGNRTSGVVSLPSWGGWFLVSIGSGTMTLRLCLQLISSVLRRDVFEDNKNS